MKVINVELLPDFRREAKRLGKKYRSLGNDIEGLIEELKKQPETGVLIQPNVRKIRLNISSKNKGKSGGARVVTYFDVLAIQKVDENEENTVYLLTLYDKADRENISDKELAEMIEMFLAD